MGSDWFKDAKDRAKLEAHYMYREMITIASEYDLDREWFCEEVMKHLRDRIKKGD